MNMHVQHVRLSLRMRVGCSSVPTPQMCFPAPSKTIHPSHLSPASPHLTIFLRFNPSGHACLLSIHHKGSLHWHQFFAD